jgi:hypothetical protein
VEQFGHSVSPGGRGLLQFGHELVVDIGLETVSIFRSAPQELPHHHGYVPLLAVHFVIQAAHGGVVDGVGQ